MSIKPISKAALKTTDTTKESAVKCSSIMLHAAINMPGVVTDKTLNQTKLPGAEMLWIPTYPIDGVLIKHRGKAYIIPKANVHTILVEDSWMQAQQQGDGL